MNDRSKIMRRVVILSVVAVLVSILVVVGPKEIERRYSETHVLPKNEISASDYRWLGEFIEGDPLIRPTVKKYLDNDGMIDEDEYYEILKLLKKHRNDLELVQNKQSLKDQLKN